MDKNKKEEGQRRDTVDRPRKRGLKPAAEQGCRKEKAGRHKVSSGSDAGGEAGGNEVHVAFSLVLMTLPRFFTFRPRPLEWEPSVGFLMCSSPSRAMNRSDAGSRKTENRKFAMHFSSATMDTCQPITKRSFEWKQKTKHLQRIFSVLPWTRQMITKKIFRANFTSSPSEYKTKPQREQNFLLTFQKRGCAQIHSLGGQLFTGST